MSEINIGDILHQFREINEMSLKELAKDIGVSVATLCRIERGDKMEAKTVLLLIDFLFREIK